MAGINFGGGAGFNNSQLSQLKAKVNSYPKPDLPPARKDTDKRPDDAPKLPPAYEKRDNKPGFGGIA